MKIVIIFNLFFAICFLIASIKFLKNELVKNKKEVLHDEVDKNESNFEWDIIKMWLVSVAILVVISRQINFDVVKQGFFISVGLQSFYYLNNKCIFARRFIFKVIGIVFLSMIVGLVSF